MNEKIYKTVSSAGAGSLVVGIITLVTGLAAGVLMIVNGARLLKKEMKFCCKQEHSVITRPEGARNTCGFSSLDRGAY